MAVDGKNASGRLAAATVLWLLVAIFANQNYVHCQGEQQQQQFQPPLQQQQQSQLPQPPLQMSQPQQPQQPPQQPQPQPQPQPQRPPNQQLDIPQSLGMSGPMNMLNDMQPNINRLAGQSTNPDNGPIPMQQLQQSLSNLGVPSNMQGDGRIPMFSGGPSMVPGTQAGGPSQMPNFDATQGINPQFRLNPQSESNPNPPQGQSQFRPPPNGNEQTNNQMNNPMNPPMNNPMNNPMNPPMNNPVNNNQQKFPESNNMLQKPMMSVPQMQYSMNHYLSSRPLAGQNLRPSLPQLYPNGNSDNMYEVPVSTDPPAGYQGQSLSNMNFGDLMRPTQMITNMLPENPVDLMQIPVGMFINTVDKLGKYGQGVKEGLSGALQDVVGKILDQGKSGARRVYDLGLGGTNAAFDFGRRILLPKSRNQQAGDAYNSPQLSMAPSMQTGYGFNPNQPPPNHMGYGMQPQAGGPGLQFGGGNGNGQVPSQQGTVPQNDYSQQRPGSIYGTNNPVNAPQPINRYIPLG